jgi:hypothetical protein
LGEIWLACGTQSWQGCGADRGSEIPQPAEQQLCGSMGQGLACSAGYSFSKLWHGEGFHKLEVQSANVSSLPGVLPQPSPWFTELTWSTAVSQLPSWIYLISTLQQNWRKAQNVLPGSKRGGREKVGVGGWERNDPNNVHTCE